MGFANAYAPEKTSFIFSKESFVLMTTSSSMAGLMFIFSRIPGKNEHQRFE